MRKSRKAYAVEAMIRSWLRSLQVESRGLRDPLDNGAYYWNEREFQWALFTHMRNLSVGHGLGAKWNVHAEGEVEQPRWSRWPGARRADVVVIEHAEFLRWWNEVIDYEPPYEAMVELKVAWSGVGRKAYLPGIAKDLRKLNLAVRDGITKNAYFVLIDGLDRDGVPYYTPSLLRRMKRGRRVRIFHWPDGEDPLVDVRDTRIGEY